MKIEITNGAETPVTKFFSAAPASSRSCCNLRAKRIAQLPANSDVARIAKERDEARADAAQLADRLSGLELRTTEELARMERDEAREETPCPHCETESYSQDERDYWKCGTIRYEEKCVVRTDLCNEREERKAAESKLAEAREQNAALRDIAERAINYLDQSYRDGFSDEASDLRYELNQLKEETK